jgi:hypothetical protein
MELTNIKNESKKLGLTPGEKAAMKARIFGMPSPAAKAPRQSPYFMFAHQFMRVRVLAPLAAVLAVFAGTGTAFAARGALPGDALYAVKVSVNETVEVALATTPVAKAQVQAKLAQRRIEEAEALAAQGSLTSGTSEKLAASFETHAQAAAELADDVAKSDPDTGASLKAALDSSLAAHGAILAALGQDNGVGDASEGIAVRVLARADAPARSMMRPAAAPQALMKVGTAAEPAMFAATLAMEAQDASTTADASTTLAAPEREEDPERERAATKLMGRAQSAVVYVRANFNDTKDSLDASTTAQVADKLSEIDALMVAGDEALQARDYDAADAAFAEALDASIRLSTVLVAQQKIRRNIVAPVLENHLIINAGTSVAPGPEPLRAL